MNSEDSSAPTLDPYEDEYSARLKRIDALAKLLDGQFAIPGTPIKFGWDGIIGLIPGIGDTVTLLPQLYILFEAIRAKVGWSVIFKMAINVGIDWLVGTLPVLGDVFDIFWKSNLRNAKLVADAIREKQAIDVTPSDDV